MKYSLQRLIAYLIVLTLVFSILPVYAGAVDSKNLIPAGLDPSFDSGINIGSSKAVNGVSLQSGLASTAYEYDSTNQCIKFTAPTNNWTNLTIRGFSFEAGKSYVVAYDAKLDGETANSVTFGVDLQGTKTLNQIYKPTKSVSNAGWTRVYSLFGCETSNNTTHLAIRFMTNSEIVLIDNLAIYEINYDADNLLKSNYSFEFAVPSNKFETSDVAELCNDGSDGCYSLKISTGNVTDGTLSNLCKFTGISVDGGYNYELSADVKLASVIEGAKAYMTASTEQTIGEDIAANISADDWTTITRTVSVINDGTIDVGIGLEGLPADSCDILVDNVVVKKSTPIEDEPTNPDIPTDPDEPIPDHPTPVDPDNLINSINYSFENTIEYTTSGIGLVKRDESCTITRTIGTDSLPAQEGNYYATITDRSGTAGGLRVQGVQAPTVGQMYIASVFVRLGEASSEKVTAKIALPGNGQNTVQATVIESPDCELSTDQWTKVYRIFKVEPKEGATEPYTNKGFHIDFSTNAAGSGLDLHVDNFDVREYTPDALTVISTTPENNATDIDKNATVIVTFNNKLVSLDAEQVSVSDGATVEEISNDGLTHTIKIKGMRNNHTYTVSLTNLEDTYGSSLDFYSFSFTTGDRVALPNLIVNPGLEDGTTGWRFSTEHWGQASEEHKSGSYSLRCQGEGEGPSCQAYQELPVEKNTKYVFSFYAKITTQTQICLREGSQEGKPTYDGTLITLTPNDQWKRYIIEFNSGDNTMVRLWLRHATNSSGPNYYDDFILSKHDGAMEIEYSSVQNGDTNVSVNIGKIVLDMSYKIDSAEIEGIADKFSIDNGAAISSVDVSADGHTVELNLSGNLKNDTTYTLTYDKITDESGITSEKGTISFTTKPAFMVVDAPELSGNTATAVVENCSSEIINEVPILIAAVYNSDKTLAYIKTSPFAGSIGAFNRYNLTVNEISLVSGQTYKLYLITSSKNMTLLTPSVGEGADFQSLSGKKTSINPQENALEVAGTAKESQEVLVLVLKTADDISSYNSYKVNTVLPVAPLTEQNIGTYVYNIASVLADENGDYNVVIPMQMGSTERIYGLLYEDDDINGKAEAIYMPSTDVYNAAKTELANVTESTFASYMDTNAKAFGISLAPPSYSARKNKILKALYGLRPEDGYIDFTSFDSTKTFKKDFYEVLAYYERQDEALVKINGATVQSLSETLTEYADVLGEYWEASKLDFNAKYTTYGSVNINRQLVGITYSSMEEFISKFNQTTYTPDSESSVVIPDTPHIGGGGGGGGAGGTSSSNEVSEPGIENIPDKNDKRFSDVVSVPWAADSINKLADMGIISGVGNGEFKPHDNVTREQFLKMLLLSLNLPIDNANNEFKFSDVNANEWYAPYVATAYKLGIVNGLPDGTFGIGMHISRQDMAVMIYRATQIAGVKLTKVRDITFEDENKISSYALESVNALSDAGIINGVSETTFEYFTNTTRAQSAVVLDRIISLEGEN